MESWALAVLVLAAIVAGLYVVKLFVQFWARRTYRHLMEHDLKTHCDIDTFVQAKNNQDDDDSVGTNNNNRINATKVMFIYKSQLGSRKPNRSFSIPLQVQPSRHVENLYVTRRLGDTTATTTTGRTTTTTAPAAEASLSLSEWLNNHQHNSTTTTTNSTRKPPVIIATIRMGFGHHRLAYSAASWALKLGHPTIFHDLLSIQSDESALIQNTDALYSKFSRWASEMGGPIEKLWGSAMMQGDADALRVANMTATHLRPLLLEFPKDSLIITTHQLCALTAAACGFTNVVNLVVDNWPQWFLTVPKTKNVVQGPVNYQCFLQMGISPNELSWAGHWCPHDLVSNIPIDCPRRILRAEQQRPLRLLVPVGGAGAQKKFIIHLVEALQDYVKNGQVQLFLNGGDHQHMKTAFLQVLDGCGLEFEMVQDTKGVRDFQQRLLSSDKNEPLKPVTLFAFDEYFPAVATTDIICRVADVLVCKPSELAFYCVPKLHIRRVGDHEAASAKRASELGDGTIEARTVDRALEFVDLFLASPDLLSTMNRAIMQNHEVGIYDGCRKAVVLAMEQRERAPVAASTAEST